VKEVAAELGNTPAVARASYIDPRLLDRYEEGVTITASLAEVVEGDLAVPAFRDAVEAAVLDLLEDGRRRTSAAA
jgi:DNA topoisomerase I